MSASDSTSTFNSEDVWFVVKSYDVHQEWFRALSMPDRPNYIDLGDDTTHPIQHIGNVPIRKEGEQTCIKNDLHVPTIKKNLVLIDQIVEQGIQVRFNNEGCFIETYGRIIARGWIEGRCSSSI